MPISAKDKVVIVTGGAGEMGSSIARRLVDEGAKVVIADIVDGSALADELSRNGKAIYVRTDVTSEESTEAMARADRRRLRSHRRPGKQCRSVYC